MPKRKPEPPRLLPPKLERLFFKPGANGKPVYARSRYKVAKGGRGSSKSWGVAGMGVAMASEKPLRILCVREYQNSIQESIHQLLHDRIEHLGLGTDFDVQAKVINGLRDYKVKEQGRLVQRRSEFIFAGIKSDPGKIKSTEGVDICIVEEAEKVSEASWKVLIPTIRKPGSEIWVVFNPREETDPTFKRFAARMPPDCRRVTMNWYDNPWFPHALEIERQYALQLIAEAKDDDERAQAQADYDHVWEGACQKHSQAAIFRRRVIVEEFPNPPERTRIHLGADWGFANDPTALIRFWITDHKDSSGAEWQELWISHEAYGYRTELDELPQLFTPIPDVHKWPIKADCSRPETISYVGRHQAPNGRGFQISAAEKWPGSVEDGIEHIKAFRKIHIHPRCKKVQEEARLYSYKVDRITGEVLPIVVDAWNHGWDAIRYGLDGYIQRRGVAGQWARLGRAN